MPLQHLLHPQYFEPENLVVFSHNSASFRFSFLQVVSEKPFRNFCLLGEDALRSVAQFIFEHESL